MITLGTLSTAISHSPTLVTERKITDDVQAAPPAPGTSTPVEGVKVSLSGEGLKKASDEKSSNPNQDIEESGLPDQAQKLLKMIRELKQKIEEKQKEMQEVMANQSLSPEVKQAQVGSLQSELATLTSSLMTASNSLDKLSKNGTLSPQQAQKAIGLAMKKS
ncbi:MULTISPECIES: coiled-coil domain-containing protein 60 [Pseudomonas]|uniref:coiled-coil domain-containing protein 60 n=1 Tax=Pseudomonas TaxID=286 RepID=UPI0010E245C4|nr:MULTISPECIES: coiled-coil domain-containing protein 60 [Pseudomonas]TCV66224.1 hypothetical protein EDB98_107232 [Pseudomonas fluorescens]